MSIETRETTRSLATYHNSDIFTATVVSCDPATMIVIVAPDGENNIGLMPAISLSSTYSAAMGFVETLLPGVGTKVLCHSRGNNTIIIGALPNIESQADATNAALPNKTILGTRDAISDSVHRHGYNSHVVKAGVLNNNSPTDTVQGEKVISNEFGVMLGLFKMLATLKASELAQVQCHFLDDLVRIVSHNFQHYTSLGQLNVFHDGKGIHLEFGATHSPNESVGNPGSNSGILEEPGQPSDTSKPYNQFYKLSDDQLNMVERMKLFVGKLGQFVNLLIVDPAPEQRSLNGEDPGQPDTGLLQVKASLDGTLVLRSVNGIYLEKTNWIRVPQRKRTPEDPTGDDGSVIDYPVTEAYKFDDTYSYRSTAFLYYLQLRDYLAYINEEVGYGNFKAHTKDFYVNDDKAKDRLNSITYIDQETGIAYKQTKSWIALMSNGGISLADAWGSCIAMEGGNIYIQPAKDLVMQPNRNLVAKIGGNTSIATRKEIDISSTEGGMRIKTNKAQYLYSSKSGIVLHSDGPTVTDSVTFVDGTTGMLENVSGIVLNAPNSCVSEYAQQVYHKAISSYVVNAQITTIDSTGLTALLSDNDVIISSSTVITAAKNSNISYSQGSNVMMGINSTVVGIKDQTFAISGFAPVQGLLDPTSNDNKQFFEEMNTITNDYSKYDLTKVLFAFADDQKFKDIQFQFPPSRIYELDAGQDVIPQTLSQQNDVASGQNNLQNWVEEAVNKSYPYPGSDFNMSLVGVAVNNIDPADINLANKATELVNKSTVSISDIFKQYKSL